MFLQLTLVAVLAALAPMPSWAAKPCPQRVSEAINADSLRPGFAFGGVVVSGHRMDYIGPNLQLDDARVQQLRDQSVLLVGEGYSDLLPHLLDRGVRNVRAIDPVYELAENRFRSLGQTLIPEREFWDYLDTYGPYLSPMSQGRWPIEAGSQDVVFSHLVISNLDGYARAKHLHEALRVLKPGGEAYIFGFSTKAVKLIEALKRQTEIGFQTYEGSVYAESAVPSYYERRPAMGLILRRLR